MAGYSVTYSVVDNATKQIDAINRRITAMRAPMERLSKQVSRFADVSGLNTIAKGFASIGRAAQSVLRSLVEIVPVLGTITGAATIAGMAKLVGSYANWSQQLTATADNLGMTTQQLQQFEDATRLAGGKTSDMDEALKGLYKTQTDFIRGQASSDQIGWLNRLGINVKDANGHLRTMADLMPEVEKKIAAIENPAVRAAASAALLGDANGNLVETFRRSHQSFGAWFSDASRYTELSNTQKEQLQAFSEAQGRIGTDFDHLGQQISATLAKNFTPLINKLAEFVEKHTPEILAAVDQISAKFADWLENVDWSKVEAGVNSLIDGLKWVVNNLDTIKDVAEAIAVAFAVKWGVGIVASVAQVVTALGPLSAALAPIAAALALITTYEKNKAGQQEIQDKAKGMGFEQQSGGAFGLPTFRNQSTGETLTYEEMMKRQGKPAGGGGWLEKGLERLWKGPAAIRQQSAVPVAPGATGSLTSALGITPAQFDAFRGSVSNIESHGKYDIMGGSSGRFAGKYQMGADEIKETAARLGVAAPTQAQFLADPSMQEKFFENYTLDHHNWLMAHNAKYAAMSPEDKAAALAYAHNQGAGGASKWIDTGMEGKDAFGTSGAAYSKAVHSAFASAAPPTQVAQAAPPPAAPAAPPPTRERPEDPHIELAQGSAPPAVLPPPVPANGNVDVNITGKNLPPNTAITASASGQGVKAAPPRVEYQELASI